MTQESTLILAIEQSTRESSLALLRGDVIVAERAWTETRARRQNLFTFLPALLSETGTDPDDIGLYAVDLGPGVFSGLRVALSTARAMALPGQRPVSGFCSAAIMARQVTEKSAFESLAVVGDARRERFWFAGFQGRGADTRMSTGLALLEASELAAALEPFAAAVTPDWDRIAGALEQAAPASLELVREACVPRAAALGHMALSRPEGGTADQAVSDPATVINPVYLHPPVRASADGSRSSRMLRQCSGPAPAIRV